MASERAGGVAPGSAVRPSAGICTTQARERSGCVGIMLYKVDLNLRAAASSSRVAKIVWSAGNVDVLDRLRLGLEREDQRNRCSVVNVTWQSYASGLALRRRHRAARSSVLRQRAVSLTGSFGSCVIGVSSFPLCCP
jgi:hypothetical protein